MKLLSIFTSEVFGLRFLFDLICYFCWWIYMTLTVRFWLCHKQASRAQILDKATEYIQYMRRKNHTHQQDIDDLKRQNALLEQQGISDHHHPRDVANLLLL